jgi:hypothetical protein
MPARSNMGEAGRLAPAQRPSATLNGPATSPFNSTIRNGSANDTLRVRLLSSPQAIQAPRIARGPRMFCRVGVPDQDRMAAPATRHIIPSSIRRSKFSWHKNHAIRAVAAPSNVRRSDAAAASVRASPHISSRGPATPPLAIAAPSHGTSFRSSGTCAAFEKRMMPF